MKPLPPVNYNVYFQRFEEKFSGKQTDVALKTQLEEALTFFQDISADQFGYAYAEGKWTIAQTLLHINDAERVMAYRALAIARGETRSLPGFDQDIYVEHSRAAERSASSLIEEFRFIRMSSISLFGSLNEEALSRAGTANDEAITAQQLGYIILGHCDHHMEILQERYLTA